MKEYTLYHLNTLTFILFNRGFPGSSDSKESAYNAGNLGSIPGLGRSPGEGNGNPLQYSCLENPMDRGAWWATVHGVTQSWTRLNAQHTTLFCSTVWSILIDVPSALEKNVTSAVVGWTVLYVSNKFIDTVV